MAEPTPSLRILAVFESLGAGGTEWQAVNVISLMARRGVHVDVVTLRPTPAGADASELRERLTSAGVETIGLDLSHRWNLAEGALRLALLARTRRADIMHARLFFPAVHVASTRALTPGLTRVVSYHNVIYDYPGQTRWDHARRLLEAKLSGGFARFAAVSETVRESYARNLGLDNQIDIVPNGIDTEEVSPTAPDRRPWAERLGVNPTLPWIVVPARFVVEKGHSYFLEAATILKARGARFQALCLGRGPLREDFVKRVEATGMADCVSAPGEVSRADLLELMAAADVVAQPSLFEGFPNTTAEAMAKAKPLVGTSIGPIAALVEPGVSGLIAPPRDADALADALKSLLDDPERRHRMGTAARARVESDFSLKRVVDLWLEFYGRAVADRR